MNFFRTLSFGVILLLCACSIIGGENAPSVVYKAPETPGGRMCTFECKNAFDHCSQNCVLEERLCVNDMQAQAIKDYESYVREQFKTHAPVALRPSDFENPDRCAQKSCRRRCKNTYDSCFTDCGGSVVKENSCQFLCF